MKAIKGEAEDGTMVEVEMAEEEDVEEIAMATKVSKIGITRRSSATIVKRKVTSPLFVPRRKRIKSSTKQKWRMQTLLSICMK